MYFEIEHPICQKTKRLCENIFVLRGYKNKHTSRYFGVTTVVKRKNNLWEATALMTNNHGPKDYQFQATNFLLSLGYRISGTVEINRLAAYKRMFRKGFKLEIINEKYIKLIGR